MRAMRCVAGLLVTVSVIGAPAAAQQADETRSNAALTTSIGHTDNLGLRSSDEIETVFYDAGIIVDWLRTGSRYAFSVSSDMVLREFDEPGFDSQLFGDFDAGLNAFLIPDRLSWDFQARVGQGRINDFQPAAPDNLQDITDFSTGPTLVVPLGRASQVNIVGRASSRQFDDVGRADNDSLLFLAQFSRAMSPSRSIGFNVSRRSIEFDDAQNSEFDFDTYVLTFNSVAARGSVSAELGFNRVEFTSDKNEGLTARFTFDRRIGAYSGFSVSAGRQLTDNGQLLGQSLGGDIFARADQIAAVSDALTRTDFGASFDLNRPRASFALSLGWIDDEFETQNVNDVELYQLAGRASRKVSARTSVFLDGRFLRRDFAVAGERNDEWFGTVGYDVDLPGRLGFGLRYTRRRLHATLREDFAENRYSLIFTWALSRDQD